MDRVSQNSLLGLGMREKPSPSGEDLISFFCVAGRVPEVEDSRVQSCQRRNLHP
jgi:hypothetical protein